MSKGRPRLIGIARAAVFNLLFFGGTLLYALAATVLVIGPRRLCLAVGRIWNRGVMALAASIAGITYEVQGLANLPDRPAVIAVKHQSAFETLALPLILDDPAFVVKRELLWIPIFGWYLSRLGMIGVDRKGGPAALKIMARRAEAALAAGRHVVIFPEGTRVEVGETRPYHPGVAALYGWLSVPVVPVALDSGLFWARRRFIKKPGKVTIEFLPAILPGLEREEFMAELARRIEAATARLCASAAG